MRIKMRQKFFCHSNMKHPIIHTYIHTLQNIGTVHFGT